MDPFFLILKVHIEMDKTKSKDIPYMRRYHCCLTLQYALYTVTVGTWYDLTHLTKSNKFFLPNLSPEKIVPSFVFP